MSSNLGKGERAEEVLRHFFLEQNYFVVRGLLYRFNGIDITDVDLWLYSKSSSMTRERTNVDVKNKKDSQVLERIFWTKGLQNSLGLERCIVATQDTKKEAKEFGYRNDVTVIDGDFLNSLLDKGLSSTRITEEDFLSGIEAECKKISTENWKKKYLESKTRLLLKLSFGGCNEYLNEIHLIITELVVRTSAKNSFSLRLLYVNVAFLLLCIDFLVKDFVYLSLKTRVEFLSNGLTYGERGKLAMEQITDAAIRLASSVIVNSSLPNTLRMEVEKQMKDRPVEILATFFSRDNSFQSLFDLSRLFEAYAYAHTVSSPSQLPAELQGVLGVLSDFFRIDRRSVLF